MVFGVIFAVGILLFIVGGILFSINLLAKIMGGGSGLALPFVMLLLAGIFTFVGYSGTNYTLFGVLGIDEVGVQAPEEAGESSQYESADLDSSNLEKSDPDSAGAYSDADSGENMPVDMSHVDMFLETEPMEAGAAEGDAGYAMEVLAEDVGGAVSGAARKEADAPVEPYVDGTMFTWSPNHFN